MAAPACIVCEKPANKIIDGKHLPDKLSVYRCPWCGLAFFTQLREHLDYWASSPQESVYVQEAVVEGQNEEFSAYLQTISALIDSDGRRLLDVGCGMGYFLKEARSCHWECSGIDLSPRAAELAEKHFGLKVDTGAIEPGTYPDGSFDVVTMWDVIEHLRDPAAVIRACKGVLRPGGILAIKTPDEDSLFKRFARGLYKGSLRLFRSQLRYVYYIPHYFSYTEGALREFLRVNGFDVVKVVRHHTNYRFARSKIKLHYRRGIARSLALLGLPVVFGISRLFSRGNKMVVYARRGGQPCTRNTM